MKTTLWRRELWLGRLRVRVTLLRHTYPTTGDRWVFQTSTSYDRRQPA